MPTRVTERHCEARGITDFDLVTVEAWGLGGFGDPSEDDRRLVWTPTWLRHHPEDNPYAHPIEGLYAIVDLNTMQVVRIEDHGATTMPEASGDYRPEAIGAPAHRSAAARDRRSPRDRASPSTAGR